MFFKGLQVSLCAFLVGVINISGTQGSYEPTWESLDARPLPSWYDEAKIGVLVHWGLYSVPGVGSEWFWWALRGQKKPSYLQFMRDNFKAKDTYASFTDDLTGIFFNPNKWAELFEHAGVKYAILTAKHQDGYCMWPSPYSYHWNSLTSGPTKDVVGEFMTAMRKKENLKAGVFYSLYEWFHPIYNIDKAIGFRTSFYPATKSVPELKDLVEKYKPDIIWSTGDWEAPASYWNSTNFLAWLYNESPVAETVVVNDRWGEGTACEHGGFLNCVDRYNPRNMLINIGVTADGMLNPIYEDRLVKLGDWMKINAEGIHGTVPWSFQNDTVNADTWYTKRKEGSGPEDVQGSVYAIFLRYPVSDLILGAPEASETTQIFMLGYGEVTHETLPDGGIKISVPPMQAATSPPYGWVLRMTNLSNA
ncbi:unnamed protein product [Notodromas monacha]|uniref:alpha-L-fucosidase n=1 Tax=Notodromas monacha TaxID=399045 RepID=A0A7R9BJZ5_9CRUS|nr:unnamed protein product [Notodromas monacha]CAG0915545.1 unnamed protein product [Notodromas monacha]